MKDLKFTPLIVRAPWTARKIPSVGKDCGAWTCPTIDAMRYANCELHGGTVVQAGSPMIEDIDLRQEVGRRIRQARELLGWTQPELGLRVGMAKQTISSYESGHRMPGPREATLLGVALGVSPAHLLVVDGDDMQLLDAEAELVRLLRQLPPEEQARFHRLLEGRARLFAQPAPLKKRPPPK
jgi:transcriptional regulator with XRE-family HTH domain